MRRWYYCAKQNGRILNWTLIYLFQIKGNAPSILIFGVQDDIYKTLQFKWYVWCYFS